jgi:LmbE family N-acetylglucosaminyl deacetylase
MSSRGAPAGSAHRLTGVFAHPDDDVYLLGGSLALHDNALDVSFVFCTSGEAGPITDPALATRETLGGVREREQKAAMARLGLEPVSTTFLRHPDYYLPDVAFDRLVAEIERALAREQPHVVVTFGPDGLTSHHDHVRAGEAAEAAFHRAREGGTRSLQRLYRVAVPRPDVDRFYEQMRALDPAYGSEGELFNLTGVDAASVAVSVDTTPVRDVKLEAILEHRTQICELERIPEPLRWIHLDRESFVQAWPPRGAGGSVARDLFAGVEATPRTS